MRRVFVSYSRDNLDIVTQLIKDLQAVGVDTWHDQTLTGGQRWWDSIIANIRECDIFIFALSPESWDSEACRGELGYVAKLGKTILPVLVSDGINLNLLSHPLNEIQLIDYRRCDKEAAFALLKSITTSPSTPPLPDPLPAPPRVPVSYLSTLKERIDATERLSTEAQITLLFELEEELEEGRSPTEVRDLLLRLKRRDELLAKVAAKIDAVLERLEDKLVVPPPGPPPPGHILPPPTAVPRFCTNCNAQVEAGLSACGNCGVALWKSGGAKVSYRCKPEDVPRLLADVRGWLDAEGFGSQQMEVESHGLLIQIMKRGGWRRYVGMDTSLNILFHQSGDTLTVEIGAGKWIDKLTVTTAVSQYFLLPLAGYGAWEQMKMPEKILDYIETRLINKQEGSAL